MVSTWLRGRQTGVHAHLLYLFARMSMHSWKIRIAHIWKICKTLGINYVYMHWLTASMVVVAPTALNCLAATCLGALGDGLSALLDQASSLVSPLDVKVGSTSEVSAEVSALTFASAEVSH